MHTPRTMRLSELLDPDQPALVVPLQSAERDPVIEELCALAAQTHAISETQELCARVLARERLMGTGIGHGVAIPHAKTAAVPHVVAACGVSPKGVDFGAPDGALVHLVVLVVSPERARTEHVRAMASVSRLVHEDEPRRALTAARDPESLWAAILGAEGTD